MMKSFDSEWLKPKIWLDSGLMVTLEEESTTVSAVWYRKKGLFKKWRILNENSTSDELSYVMALITKSSGKSIRTMGVREDIKYLVDGETYRFSANEEVGKLFRKKNTKF